KHPGRITRTCFVVTELAHTSLPFPAEDRRLRATAMTRAWSPRNAKHRAMTWRSADEPRRTDTAARTIRAGRAVEPRRLSDRFPHHRSADALTRPCRKRGRTRLSTDQSVGC